MSQRRLADQTIRVIVVDDQLLLRQGFQRLLELDGKGIAVVGSAADGQEALDVLERMAASGDLPHVVLMDIRMPHMDGVEATVRLRERWPSVRVLILTTFDDDELILAGLRAGAHGYLLKDASARELVAAIRAVHANQSPLQPAIAAKLIAQLTRAPQADLAVPSATGQPPASQDPGNDLTDREIEILGLVARGASNREIGESLFITEGTVKNHVSSILSKLGLRDRTQAALWAREHLPRSTSHGS